MADAISSCIANTSVIGRSYRSDHKWVPSAAAISCAVTRIRSPARRTLPSSTLVTPSACAMWRTSSFLPLNENADVRAITFSPSTCASALMISSARPSPKYSFSRSALRLANGSTAIDAATSAVPTRQVLQGVPDVGHRLESAVGILGEAARHDLPQRSRRFERTRIVAQHGAEDLCGGVAREGPSARQQFIQHCAEAEHVRSRVERLALPPAPGTCTLVSQSRRR